MAEQVHDRLNGYNRVTEIISPFSGIEFVPEKYLLPASLRGTRVHQAIEGALAGFGCVDDPELAGYMASFDKFRESHVNLFECNVILEKRLYCDEWKITGQLDVILESEDGTYLIDWKTGSKPQKKSWSLQAAGYRYLCEINGYKDVDVLFVKLDKNGKKPSLYKFDDYEESLATFFKCLELYRYFEMHKNRGKRSTTPT